MKSKQFLSLLLSIVMILGLAPASVLADNALDTNNVKTVTFTAQASGDFLCAPQIDVDISGNLAENYGYKDNITDGVSALDVLVKAHEVIFNADAEAINNALAVGESGWITDAFGCGSNFGFAVNGKTPYDASSEYDSSYGYIGYTIDKTKIENNSTVEFFIYQDTYATDNYVWFEQNSNKLKSLAMVAGQNITLDVKGYCICYYGTMKDDIICTMTESIENARICLINKETGEKTNIKNAITDENGSVTFNVAEAGEYLLSAYIASEDITENYATPAIMPILPLTVEENKGMSDEEAVNKIYTEFSTKSNNYTSSANTPLVFPLEYDGQTYTNVIEYIKAWGKKETGRDINIEYKAATLTTSYEEWKDGSAYKYIPTAFDENTEITPGYYKDNLPLSQRIGNIIFSVGSVKSEEMKTGIYAKVESKIRTPDEIVSYIADNLPFERIKGKNDSKDYIVSVLGTGTGKLSLPTADSLYTKSSATISWSLIPETEGDTALKLSSNNITVTRPNVGEPDAKFILKAEIVSTADENIKQTVEYNLTVPAFENVIVPVQVTEGATLSIKDGVYNIDVADRYIAKQENAPAGYNLYHLSLHSNTTGTNATFTCTVTKDGYITKTEKISVGTTAPEETVVIDLTQSSENDTKLSSLEILTPSVSGFVYDPEVTEYNIEVKSGTYVKIAGIPYVSEATAKITSYYSSLSNANKGTLTTTGKTLTESGVNCYLPDEQGSYVVKITVTAPEGSTQEVQIKEYILNIKKTGTNAPLTALTLTASSSGEATKNNVDIEAAAIEETLTPAFVSGAKEDVYHYTVNYFRDKISVKPTAANCTITVNDTVVASGKVSEPINLEVGDNEIKVKVSDETNTTEYKIIVHRKAELIITDVALDNGSLNTQLAADGSSWAGSCSFAYDADKVNVTYNTNITENVSIMVVCGDKTYSGVPGKPIEIDVKNTDKFMSAVYIIHNNNGVIEAQKYIISLIRSASTYPSSVESFLPAPGQFVNIDSYMAPGKVISGTGMVTLGAFGGNVVYKYDEPIKNSENNPYGIDFIIAGNAFTDTDGTTSSGAAEPASVMVSKDGAVWYELAGSEYYSAETERNLTVTYTNPDITFKKAVNVSYLLSNGESGNVLANDYHKQAYYPNPQNYNVFQDGVGKNNTYTAETVTFEGTLIKNGFYPFGYADSHSYVNGNTAVNPYVENHQYVYNGDGFDIDWAVDRDGNPVELDEISYIKIYNSLIYNGGSTGEKSAEISKITKVESDSSPVGTSKGLSKLTVNGKEIALQSDVYTYNIDAEDASTLEVIPETENANANIYVSNKRVTSGNVAKLTSVSKLRVIVQEGRCEPVIYILNFSNAQTAERNADLSSLVLTPGDDEQSPDGEGKLSFDVDSLVSSIRLTATTAGKGASISVSGGTITDTITLKSGEQSSAISISKGKNEFLITVISEDTTNTKIYNITVNRAEGTSGSQSGNTITVKFSLIGDKVHYNKEKEEYTGTHSAQTWIAQKSVTIPKGSTVKYLTEMMLNNANIDYMSDGIYISEIKGLAEFDNGPNSGWMYRYNGQLADEGYAARKLENGDVIKWFYTDDYTKETGYESNWDKVNTSGSGSSIKKEDDKAGDKTEVKTETTVSGNTAKVTTSEKNITNAITDAKKNNNSSIVIAPSDTKDAINMILEISSKSVQDIAESGNLSLEIETASGNVSISNEALSSIVEQLGTADDVKINIAIKTADEVSKDTANIADAISNDELQNAIIVEVAITSGNTSIRTFGGHSLNVDVPADGKKYEKGKTYKVYIISPDGSVEITYGECVEKNGQLYVSVQTKYLASFVVTDIGPAPFTDIADHWAFDAIEYVCNLSVMQGVSETEFAPNNTMTRAMLVTVLYRLENPTEKTKSHSFADVKDGEWYTDAVSWAAENGIVNGVSETEFAPNTDITREQMAAVLYRYAQYKDKHTSIGEDANIFSYTDAEKISEYAIPAMQWMIGAGLMNGETESTINPQNNSTRAQVATILMRYLEQ